jgi:threonine/homoserine/homoserine lactone efflux protein
MAIHTWLIYLTITAITAATPGPAVLLAVTNSTLYGWKKSVFSALGNITALLFMGIITISGLEAILTTSEQVFNIIKYLGAAYLIYIGIKMFFQKNAITDDEDSVFEYQDVSPLKLGIQAFGVAMSNPKAILFLTALFPQFINTANPIAIQFSILMVTLMVLSFSFLMFYAIIAYKAKSWLISPDRIRIVNRTSGALFVGIGLLLATSSRK